MKKKYKAYLRLNIMSIFFIAVSFISVTLAWFAYSGLATARTEIDVKAWYIEFDKNNETVSNEIVISLDEIYPGMETVHEEVNIKNKGDSDASVNYNITSARILNDEYNSNLEESTIIEDRISHDYPFHVNINIDKNYVLSGGETKFDISVSWPLDSDNDLLDSEWGNKAYNFQQNENNLLLQDPSHQIRPSIKVIIDIKAEQYVESLTASDKEYNKGDIILYDIKNNRSCTSLSDTCIKTYIIDENSKVGDTTLSLLPDVYGDYQNGTFNDYSNVISNLDWNVEVRELTAGDILNIVSTDILNSVLKRNNMSDMVIGYLKVPTRLSSELLKATNYNGYYSYLTNEFNFITSNSCYWTNTSYNDNKGFAFKRDDQTHGKIYGEDNNTSCGIIPIILAPKSNIVD